MKISEAIFHEILNAGYQMAKSELLPGYLHQDANKTVSCLYKKYVEQEKPKYNLTFNEAVAAGRAGNIISNDFNHVFYRFKNNEWQHNGLTAGHPIGAWIKIETLLYEEEKAKWRIAEQEKPETSITEQNIETISVGLTDLNYRLEDIRESVAADFYILDSRIEMCEDKINQHNKLLEQNGQLAERIVEKITKFDSKISEFEKKLDYKHEEWEDGAYHVVVQNFNAAHYSILKLEQRLDNLESTILMKIDFDERLKNLENHIKPGGTE